MRDITRIITVVGVCGLAVTPCLVLAQGYGSAIGERFDVLGELSKRSPFAPVNERSKEDTNNDIWFSFVGEAGDGKLVGQLQKDDAFFVKEQILFGKDGMCQKISFYPDGLLKDIFNAYRYELMYDDVYLWCESHSVTRYFDPLGLPLPSGCEIHCHDSSSGYFGLNYAFYLYHWRKPDGSHTVWYYILLKDDPKDVSLNSHLFGKTAVNILFDDEQKTFSVDTVKHYLSDSQFQIGDPSTITRRTEFWSSDKDESAYEFLPINVTFVDWRGVTNTYELVYEVEIKEPKRIETIIWSLR